MASPTQPVAPETQGAPLFRDFDDEAVFDEITASAVREDRKNFVLEFGPLHARIATDLTALDFQALAEKDRDAHYPIRWINIWNASDQREVIDILGGEYEFSRRLTKVMTLDPEIIKAASRSLARENSGAAKSSPANSQGEVVDEEKGPEEDSTRLEVTASTGQQFNEDLDLYMLMKDTVNYTSIDQTERAVCIGAHWLYRKPRYTGQPRSNNIMPPKHWLWLAITNDNVVLSIHEKPTFGPCPTKLSEDVWQRDLLRSMRANTLKVLRQQSVQGAKLFDQNPLSMSSVREALKRYVTHHRGGLVRLPSDPGQTEQARSKKLGAEGASNLFYYLFEDYVAASPLSTAGKMLADLTQKVLDSAKRRSKVRSTDIIPHMHSLSKELRELKHLFENYNILIRKIILSTKHSAASHLRPPMLGSRRETMLTEVLDGDESTMTPEGYVTLSQSALSRFDRLRARIDGLMLNAIQGHLEDIKAVSDTYFNLTQQKDSQATARLTRSATMIAKLTVFFLPISFMTSYFSVQIPDLFNYWTAQTYWYSFAVIASFTFVCLFFFGRMLMFFSDVADDWSVAVSNWFRRMAQRCGFNMTDVDEEDS